MPTWPPDLDAYKVDAKLDPTDDRFDAALQVTLDAAVAYVERVRSDVDYGPFREPPVAADTSRTELVTDDLVLGTIRYARRLDARRDSVSGMIVVDQVGATPVAGWDADTEKLLRVGRYARLRFA